MTNSLKSRFAKVLDLRSVIGDQDYIVIGDLHGCAHELHTLFVTIHERFGWGVGKTIPIVLLGDLTDRGPRSGEVVDLIRSLPHCYCCLGNHDWKLSRALNGNNVKRAHGLQETLSEFDQRYNPAERKKVREFLDGLPNIIQLPDVQDGDNLIENYAVHAGFDPRRDPDKQTREDTLYIRYVGGANYFDSEGGHLWYEDLKSRYHVFHGHIVSVKWKVHSHVTALDGGVFCKGVLRAAVLRKGSNLSDRESWIVEVPSSVDWKGDAPEIQLTERGKVLEAIWSKCSNSGAVGEE